MISGTSLVLSRKMIASFGFTGAAPRRVSVSGGKKFVSDPKKLNFAQVELHGANRTEE